LDERLALAHTRAVEQARESRGLDAYSKITAENSHCGTPTLTPTPLVTIKATPIVHIIPHRNLQEEPSPLLKTKAVAKAKGPRSIKKKATGNAQV
jgi:hypothetical protein